MWKCVGVKSLAQGTMASLWPPIVRTTWCHRTRGDKCDIATNLEVPQARVDNSPAIPSMLGGAWESKLGPHRCAITLRDDVPQCGGLAHYMPENRRTLFLQLTTDKRRLPIDHRQPTNAASWSSQSLCSPCAFCRALWSPDKPCGLKRNSRTRCFCASQA